MAAKHADELAALAKLRAKYPKVPQREFARQIWSSNFSNPQDRTDAATLLSRTEKGVYGMVRRHDRRVRGAVQQHLQTAGVVGE